MKIKKDYSLIRNISFMFSFIAYRSAIHIRKKYNLSEPISKEKYSKIMVHFYMESVANNQESRPENYDEVLLLSNCPEIKYIVKKFNIDLTLFTEFVITGKRLKKNIYNIDNNFILNHIYIDPKDEEGVFIKINQQLKTRQLTKIIKRAVNLHKKIYKKTKTNEKESNSLEYERRFYCYVEVERQLINHHKNNNTLTLNRAYDDAAENFTPNFSQESSSEIYENNLKMIESCFASFRRTYKLPSHRTYAKLVRELERNSN